MALFSLVNSKIIFDWRTQDIANEHSDHANLFKEYLRYRTTPTLGDWLTLRARNDELLCSGHAITIAKLTQTRFGSTL